MLLPIVVQRAYLAVTTPIKLYLHSTTIHASQYISLYRKFYVFLKFLTTLAQIRVTIFKAYYQCLSLQTVVFTTMLDFVPLRITVISFFARTTYVFS